MFANRYLARWQSAGLIDDAAAQRIASWERAQARPVWLWALAGLGAFAVGMGMLALVAANWERIPGWLKIAVSLTLDAGLAVAVFIAWRRTWERTREILALILFGLVLGSIALISQVYQLDGEPWQAMLVWMAVCTPFLALVTRSRVLGIVWAVAATATYLLALDPLSRVLGRWLDGEAVILIAWVPGLALLAVGIVRGWLPSWRGQAHAIVACGVLALLLAASIPQLIVFRPKEEAGTVVAAVATVLLAALLWRERRRDTPGATALMVIVLTGLGAWLATMAIWKLAGANGVTFWTRRSTDGLPYLCAALVFIAFWAVVSWLALQAGRRALFVMAFAVITVRIFIIYWEAFGGLFNTGLGLIGGGLLCLAFAALGWHLARRAGRPMEAAI
ncbi:DUF2157 domain-containing protein [Vineibacter terrae]|uniref:DUF2157 domain-containing protein n=1 Tax=Vineibacter terrae TaxID=2586908 RepID=UPI002E309AB1|nr:DUF2157 domain-containing protein [Vineibacter terrae]HEX2889994.1 DUF2157 domain-containing protein [Vineibacter terrae]